MKLDVYCSLWVYPGTPAHSARSIAAAGYDGLEAIWPETASEQSVLVEATRAEGLKLAPLLLLDGETPAEEADRFRSRLEQALPYDPDRIVVHAGRDRWPLAEAIALFERIVATEAELGVRCAHETHRCRPLGFPWTTAAILDAVPDLWLCCDFSHWVLVCERLLEDETEAVAAAARRALHLHARVGTTQAPQVVDPADPRVAPQRAIFEGWWEAVWDSQAAAGFERSTLTPEYCPPPYQASTADAGALPALLAQACEWQAARARERFERRFSAAPS
ncbi:MAG: hypothetical protein QOE75_48 [Solirubrobacterales bacterium]|jgi:sugar phosphate isomerase/epimerase|nr:hypothetical protein [Solirubrobacterales bacterium]